MENWALFSSLLVFLACVHYSQAYRVLVVAHTGAKSHYNVGFGIATALANAGHQVTMVAPFKASEPVKNMKEVVLDGVVEEMKKQMENFNFTEQNDKSVLTLFPLLYGMGNLFTKNSLYNPIFRDFLHSDQQFDVVIVEIFLSDAFLGIGPHFNAPIIGFSTFGSSKWTFDLVGTPAAASFVPAIFYDYTDRMTFWQRLHNVIYYWIEEMLHPILFDRVQEQMYEEVFPGANKPTLADIRRNVSLVFLNTHASFGFPRPYAPNMIEIGGLHINRNPDPLPKDIQKFLDDARDGAIFFSLGSNMRSTMMSEYKAREIISAFAGFSKYRILFKWDQNVLFPSHKVSDVMVKNWFPQESILAHSNVKLFITHGGLLSTQESLCFGKPVVGVPIFAEQKLNMKFAENVGYGLSVTLQELTTEKLEAAIQEVLANPSFSENAALSSQRYRDQLNTPAEVAVHWVEHVARHKGAPHLRLASVDLPFYKYYNWDVYAFIGIGVYLVIYALKKLLSSSSVCRGRSSTKQDRRAKVE